MNNPELNDSQAAADFDARCKALLEHRTVDAPAPREGLFNDAGNTVAWGRRAAWAAAAVIILAAVALWPDAQHAEKVSTPEPAVATTPATPVSEGPSADETEAVLETSDNPESVEVESAVSETPAAAIRVEETGLPSAVLGNDPKPDLEVVASGIEVEEGTMEKSTDVEAVGKTEPGAEPLISRSAPAPEAIDGDEPAESTEESAIEEDHQPEDAGDAEGAPTLKLPLQLKSGGGQ